MSLVSVPPTVRARALSEGAVEWLRQLPSLVAGLEREWDITVAETYSGGSEAFVARVTLPDSSPAVLKVLIPRDDDSARNEITVLRLAGGDGCASLLNADIARSAMLLEHLGTPLHQSGLPPTQRREILASTAQRLWRPATGFGFPTGADKGRWLVQFISSTWADLGRPCSVQAVAYALECAERRIAAHDDGRSVLVHGDIHELNTLASGSGYKLIDPDGLLAEPEYDLGVVMRQDPIDPTDPRASARWLAQRTSLDETAIWEWATVERLSTALVCTTLDLQPMGSELLATADVAAQLNA